MFPETNIILAGPMGSGKTTVGKLIAERLGREFWDTDSMIEEATGIPIVRLFSERSEAYFRALESEIISTLESKKCLVIAAGGGMTVPDENYRRLNDSGVLICLRATTDTILQRLNDTNNRPLLNEGDRRRRLEEILDRRRDAYNRIRLHVDTDDASIEEVAEQVLEIYNRQASNG